MEKVLELLNNQGAFFSKYALLIGVAAVFLGIGQTYITVALGVAYPAYMSFLALETEETEDDTQWLTYWVCFGLFNIIDQWIGFILHFIPFYFVIKLCFLVYLFHPSTMGATTVYNAYILPIMKQYEPHIIEAEKKIQQYTDMAGGIAAQAKSKVMGSKPENKKEE